MSELTIEAIENLRWDNQPIPEPERIKVILLIQEYNKQVSYIQKPCTHAQYTDGYAAALFYAINLLADTLPF